MWYWYFIDFQHCISVFPNFSYGIVVLGTPQCPPPGTDQVFPVIQITQCMILYVYKFAHTK